MLSYSTLRHIAMYINGLSKDEIGMFESASPWLNHQLVSKI